MGVEGGGSFHSLLFMALLSCPSHFFLFPLNGRLSDPRALLGAFDREKNLLFLPLINHSSLVVQPVA